jgi:hypothetical protein
MIQLTRINEMLKNILTFSGCLCASDRTIKIVAVVQYRRNIRKLESKRNIQYDK